jgi:TRAP-type C4-dicarboxylate transport system permease large subunit
MDGVAAMILLIPVMLPIATGIYDVPPIQFGVIVVLTLVLGLLTPPVGAALYIASGIANISPWQLFAAVMPYLLVGIVLVFVLCFFPWLVDFWI